MNTSAQIAALIYTHLPRTAGTTLNGILHREYGEQFYKVSDGLAIEHGVVTAGREPFVTLSEDDRRRYRAIAGHMSYGIHAWVPGPTRYVTIVRDPVDRVISLYHYIAETPTHRLHHKIAVEGWTLDNCLGNDPAWPMLQYNNGQLRMLTGAVTADKLAKGVHSLERLSEALQYLRQYDLVGTTDRFDEFLAIAWRRYGWKLPLAARSNATKTRFPVDRLAESTRQRILELNAMDAALYDYARRRMDEAAEQAGPSLAQALAELRARNVDRG